MHTRRIELAHCNASVGITNRFCVLLLSCNVCSCLFSYPRTVLHSLFLAGIVLVSRCKCKRLFGSVVCHRGRLISNVAEPIHAADIDFCNTNNRNSWAFFRGGQQTIATWTGINKKSMDNFACQIKPNKNVQFHTKLIHTKFNTN